jgi:hypothetical protein
MSTRNSSARTQRTGFNDGNETWTESIILYTTSSQMLLDSPYNRIFHEKCQRFALGLSPLRTSKRRVCVPPHPRRTINQQRKWDFGLWLNQVDGKRTKFCVINAKA